MSFVFGRVRKSKMCVCEETVPRALKQEVLKLLCRTEGSKGGVKTNKSIKHIVYLCVSVSFDLSLVPELWGVREGSVDGCGAVSVCCFCYIIFKTNTVAA